MKSKLKFFLVIAVVLILGAGVFVFLKKFYFEPNLVNEPLATTPVGAENPTTTGKNLKTYRNEEWGFEFEYPAELSIKEKVFGGYYSQFNLVLFKHISESRDWAVIINIVLPEFVDTAFWKSQENTSKIFVDGVEGTKVSYEYEGSPQIDIILPLNNLKIILGTGEGSYIYKEELNQILSSFRFIEK